LKLLFDENLSFRLARALDDLFPGSRHVDDLGLEAAADEAVWHFAAEQGYAIVTKDADFAERSLLEGAPPQVIWIRRGNCSTRAIEELLRARRDELEAFAMSAVTLLRLL
jgi:predicted nuclease of predicted toxin-antitoxin system